MRNLVLLFDAFNKDEFEARVESLRIAYMNMKSCIRSLNYSEKKANEEKKRSSDTARRAGSTNNAGSSEGMFARLRWPTAWSSLEASGGVDVVAAAFAVPPLAAEAASKLPPNVESRRVKCNLPPRIDLMPDC